MVELLGIEWGMNETEDSKKFLLLLVHLACIEVRMAIEGKTFEDVSGF